MTLDDIFWIVLGAPVVLCVAITMAAIAAAALVALIGCMLFIHAKDYADAEADRL